MKSVAAMSRSNSSDGSMSDNGQDKIENILAKAEAYSKVTLPPGFSLPAGFAFTNPAPDSEAVSSSLPPSPQPSDVTSGKEDIPDPADFDIQLDQLNIRPRSYRYFVQYPEGTILKTSPEMDEALGYRMKGKHYSSSVVATEGNGSPMLMNPFGHQCLHSVTTQLMDRGTAWWPVLFRRRIDGDPSRSFIWVEAYARRVRSIRTGGLLVCIMERDVTSAVEWGNNSHRSQDTMLCQIRKSLQSRMRNAKLAAQVNLDSCLDSYPASPSVVSVASSLSECPSEQDDEVPVSPSTQGWVKLVDEGLDQTRIVNLQPKVPCGEGQTATQTHQDHSWVNQKWSSDGDEMGETVLTTGSNGRLTFKHCPGEDVCFTVNGHRLTGIKIDGKQLTAVLLANGHLRWSDGLEWAPLREAMSNAVRCTRTCATGEGRKLTRMNTDACMSSRTDAYQRRLATKQRKNQPLPHIPTNVAPAAGSQFPAIPKNMPSYEGQSTAPPPGSVKEGAQTTTKEGSQITATRVTKNAWIIQTRRSSVSKVPAAASKVASRPAVKPSPKATHYTSPTSRSVKTRFPFGPKEQRVATVTRIFENRVNDYFGLPRIPTPPLTPRRVSLSSASTLTPTASCSDSPSTVAPCGTPQNLAAVMKDPVAAQPTTVIPSWAKDFASNVTAVSGEGEGSATCQTNDGSALILNEREGESSPCTRGNNVASLERTQRRRQLYPRIAHTARKNRAKQRQEARWQFADGLGPEE